MNILLCGASGFIGQEMLQALSQAGHQVVRTRSASANNPSTTPGSVSVDFARDTKAEVWLPRLAGMDAVINVVGVLRDSSARPIQAVHQTTPCALFDACAQAGVRRVIQVSALGVEGNPTRYARTKLAADQHLLGLLAQGQLDAVVLRPSIVFGAQGHSSKLFMMLARSPMLCLPRAVITAKVQPVAVQDLAQAVVQLLGASSDFAGVLPCVGPSPLTLAALIASLRQQRGHGAATVMPLPEAVTRLSVRLGDHVPWAPWCSETLALLAQDNVAPPAAFAHILGRAATPPHQLVSTSWH
jgi:uncharacterized protein YbjT (DUF2867 family)